ncbi:MAG: hypothetical protein R2911_32915 [Caldilineaceae bacterium]
MTASCRQREEYLSERRPRCTPIRKQGGGVFLNIASTAGVRLRFPA